MSDKHGGPPEFATTLLLSRFCRLTTIERESINCRTADHVDPEARCSSYTVKAIRRRTPWSQGGSARATVRGQGGGRHGSTGEAERHGPEAEPARSSWGCLR